MNDVIGSILPLALTVAISPVPIIATILVLLSPRATATGLAFLLGWTVGMSALVAVFTLLALLAAPGVGGSPVVGVTKIVLGILLLVVGLLQWRNRPRKGDAPVVPRWMSALDSITVPRAALLAFLLAAVNPKHVIVALGAGVDIGASGLGPRHVMLAMGIFVLVTISTVAMPVLVHLIVGDRVRSAFESLRGWLTINGATVMGILLVVIGVANVGQGVAAV